MGSIDRYNLSGEIMPTQPVANSAALYGGQYAPVTRRDKRNEREHFTDVRQMQRRAVEQLAEVQAGALIAQAEIDAEFQSHRERKLAVAASDSETVVMAGDNPVLHDKLSQMDVVFARRLLLRGMGGR